MAVSTETLLISPALPRYMDNIDAYSVVCLVCKDTLKYSGGTSSMIKHIRTKHPLGYVELREDVEAEREPPAKVAQAASSTVQPTLLDTINRA